MENFNPASETQINYIKGLAKKVGVEVNTEGLTTQEASELISQLRDSLPTENKEEQETKKEDKKVEKKNEIVSKTTTAVIEKNISDNVLNQLNNLVETQGLVLPDGYNPTNALKAAYLLFVKNDLIESTDKHSQARALLDMCIQGLDPSKNQCYFIKYNSEVQMMRSYFGDKQVCTNSHLTKDIDANLIYKGDVVNVYYQDNNKMKVEHKTNWANISSGEIVGAYAYAVLPDGSTIYDIMTLERIKKSWMMSKNYGDKNKFQNNFSDDACKRTVIRHLAKNIFNAGNTTSVIAESYNRTTSEEYDNNKEYKENSIDAVIKTQEEQTGQKDLFDENGVVEDDNI